MIDRLAPTGPCWCGCGGAIGRGPTFLVGRDKLAEADLIPAEYGGVRELLFRDGYAPGCTNPHEALME